MSNFTFSYSSYSVFKSRIEGFFGKAIMTILLILGGSVSAQPVFVSSVTKVGTTSPANVNAFPANVAEGDLLVASIVYSGSSTTSITAPANWTLILQSFRSTIGIATYYAKYVNGLSSSFTINSGTNWSMSISRITGAAECGIISAESTKQNSTSISTPAISTTNTNTILLHFFANQINTNLNPPSGYTAAFNAPTTGLSHMLIQYSKVAAGAAAGLSVTSTQTSNVAQQIAISTKIDKPTASSPQSFCSGGTAANLSASGLSGATINWYTVATGGTPLTSTTALTSGTYYVSQRNTNGESCERTAVLVNINALPVTQTYTSSGIYSYCAGTGGSELGLTSSESGINYQLQLSGSSVGSAVSGTGAAISLGTHTTAGTYTVLATNITTGCNRQLGNASLSSKPLPVVYSVGGGGTFCTGNTGKTITLSNSQTGVTYQLTKNGSIADGSQTGTNNTALSFTNKGAGSYTISATLNGCSTSMSGSATIEEVSAPQSGTISGNQSLYIGLNSTLSSTNAGGIWSSSNTAVASVNSSGLATGVAAGSATITYTVSNAGCSAASTIGLTVNPGNVWTGNTDSKWTGTTNWGMGRVPISTDDVIIPSVAKLPVIGSNSNITISNLSIQSGAHLKVDGTLFITGSVSNSGYIDGTAGSVGFTGTTAQIIPAGLFLSNTLKNLRISNAAGVTLSGDLILTESLMPALGTLNTGGFLTLKSDQNFTAFVAEGPSSGGYVVGDVTVERYISSRGNKGYRFLAPSVNSSGTIHANWQEGVNNTSTTVNIPSPKAGYGTHITGLGGASNGFDASSAYGTWTSLYTFNNTNQSWQAVSNTNATSLSGKTGYLIYIRGNRDDITPVSTQGVNGQTTLRVKGSLLQGTQLYSGLASIGNYSAIANPYACALSWQSISNTNSNVEGIYWIWDPNINQSGGYVAVDRSGIKSVSQSNASDIIPTGMSFFVKRSSSIETFTIEESHKSTNNNIDMFSNESEPPSVLSVSLLYNQNQQKKVADGAVVAFHDQYSSEVNSADGTKFANASDNISILNSGIRLSIDKRAPLQANDSIHLMMNNLSQTKYELEFAINLSTTETLNFKLYDRFTKSFSDLTTTDKTSYSFEINSEPASKSPDRFVIVVTSSYAPVNFYRVQANKELGYVNVTWAVDQENNIVSYNVEKSNNGKSFVDIGKVAPKGNDFKLATYDFADFSTMFEDNYYRIKLTDRFGKNLYSAVSYLKNEAFSNKLSTYPNPVISGILQINMASLDKGKYFIQVLDHQGRSVFEKAHEHDGQPGNLKIDLSSKFLKGNFILKLQKNNDQPIIRKIVFL